MSRTVFVPGPSRELLLHRLLCAGFARLRDLDAQRVLAFEMLTRCRRLVAHATVAITITARLRAGLYSAVCIRPSLIPFRSPLSLPRCVPRALRSSSLADLALGAVLRCLRRSGSAPSAWCKDRKSTQAQHNTSLSFFLHQILCFPFSTCGTPLV